VLRHRGLKLAVVVAALAGGLALRGVASGSDHQDTPLVEINSRCDINDVYAFPGSSSDRIVLVMTTSSPLPAGSNAVFDTDKLYQLKIDNDSPGDGVEDLVLQFTFEGSGSDQEITVRGPVSPPQTGTRNRISGSGARLTGKINTTLGAASGVQVFAGLRDDPFFLDLEQFFRIIPDRKPVTGGLSGLPDTPTASAFRGPGDAQDYLAGLNCLAIVVEMPASMLTAGGTSRLGIWGTVSR